MLGTTIALTAAILGMALLLLPATEAAAYARVRRTKDPDNKPKR